MFLSACTTLSPWYLAGALTISTAIAATAGLPLSEAWSQECSITGKLCSRRLGFFTPLRVCFYVSCRLGGGILLFPCLEAIFIGDYFPIVLQFELLEGSFYD